MGTSKGVDLGDQIPKAVSMARRWARRAARREKREEEMSIGVGEDILAVGDQRFWWFEVELVWKVRVVVLVEWVELLLESCWIFTMLVYIGGKGV